VLRTRFEREHRQLSQQHLARLARLPQSTISQIETGRLRPTAEELARLAAVFNVAPSDLLKDVVIAETRR